MHAILIQRTVPIYREKLFQNLKSFSNQNGISLEILASKPDKLFHARGTTADQGVQFNTSVLFDKDIFGFNWQVLPWRRIMRADIVIVPDSLRTVSNIFVICLRKLMRKPVVTWGHGKNFQPSFLSNFLENIRFRIIKLADGMLVYSNACIPPILAKGYPRKRIAITGNASTWPRPTSNIELADRVVEFKRNLGLIDEPCIAFLGSFYVQKRPERIKEIGQILRRSITNLQIVVIGGGDGVELLRKDRPDWLHLIGPRHGIEQTIALQGCECMATSGIAGLNILDAFQAGLPVVAPVAERHSPEFDFLQNGFNSIITKDSPEAIAAGCLRVINEKGLNIKLKKGAQVTADYFSVDAFCRRFVDGFATLSSSTAAVKDEPVLAFVLPRILDHHRDRITEIANLSEFQNTRVVVVQVSDQDLSYGHITSTSAFLRRYEEPFETITLFPNKPYDTLRSCDVNAAVTTTLSSLAPSYVFTTAPAFAEGVASLRYKMKNSLTKVFLMDDAWEKTDFSNVITKFYKRQLYRGFDGSLLPSRHYSAYYSDLGIPERLQRYGLNCLSKNRIIKNSAEFDLTDLKNLPERFFICVSRLIPRKNVDVLIHAFASLDDENVKMLCIGDGPELQRLKILVDSLHLSNRVLFFGRITNDVTAFLISKSLGLLIPSQFDQWALVANEAWSLNIPVVGSETTGAVKAAAEFYPRWMTIAAGDVAGWSSAMNRLLTMTDDESSELTKISEILCEKFSVENFGRSVSELVNLPRRESQGQIWKFFAALWRGRVKIW